MQTESIQHEPHMKFSAPTMEQRLVSEKGFIMQQSLNSLRDIIRQINLYQPDQTDGFNIEVAYQQGKALLTAAQEAQAVLKHASNYYPSHPVDQHKLIELDLSTINELGQRLEDSYLNKIARKY